MATVRYTRGATQDYADIWLYVARDSPTAADRLLEAIDRMAHDLAEQPGMGRSRSQFRSGLRSISVKKTYLIFYRPIGDGIEVIRVLHGARKITRGMFRP